MDELFPEQDGWIFLIDKPEGWTSFDVVKKVKSITGIKKIGHAGTLDPMATGLLVLAGGKATKTLTGGLSGSKRYTGTIQLGASSPTWDSDASYILKAHIPQFSEETICACLTEIKKQETQFPPMMAAIKKSGKRFYKLARQGFWILREKREVNIERLDYLEYNPELAQVAIDVEGSGGLYVRSIAHDLGCLLGVPALLQSLRRTEVQPYKIDDAISLDTLKEYWSRA
ncbi:tRNA pseudouridine(55) synthase TruB [bacterium]|nr:tRNA pseudouridine(55) synthase TruB [bacterium]